jgi:hypothetical protein
VVAPMRLATKRSRFGWTVRSSLATMFTLDGEDRRQANRAQLIHLRQEFSRRSVGRAPRVHRRGA